jgi:hypothetical protein
MVGLLSTGSSQVRKQTWFRNLQLVVMLDNPVVEPACVVPEALDRHTILVSHNRNMKTSEIAVPAVA